MGSLARFFTMLVFLKISKPNSCYFTNIKVRIISLESRIESVTFQSEVQVENYCTIIFRECVRNLDLRVQSVLLKRALALKISGCT